MVTDPIARLTPTGIETADGTVREVDTIVTAIGFEIVQFLWPADYIGRDGLNVHDFWSKDGPRAYLSMMVPNYPNMFMLYGPNSQPLSGGTGLPIWYQVWSGYAAQCIVRMLEEGQTSVEVTMDAYERYNEALDKEASKLLLMHEEGAPDKNYYLNQTHNRLQMSAPGTARSTTASVPRSNGTTSKSPDQHHSALRGSMSRGDIAPVMAEAR